MKANLGTAGCELVMCRAIAGDVGFFNNLFDCGIEFEKGDVLEIAIKYNHRRILQNWPPGEWNNTLAL
jgi:hypothetical protein